MAELSWGDMFPDTPDPAQGIGAPVDKGTPEGETTPWGMSSGKGTSTQALPLPATPKPPEEIKKTQPKEYSYDEMFPHEPVPAATENTSGPLANAPDEGWLSGAAKGATTGVIKGLLNIPGQIGNLGQFADYLSAIPRALWEHEPIPKAMQDLAQQRTQMEARDPLLAFSQNIAPQNIFPTGAQLAAPILRQTGEYAPMTLPGRMAQSGIEAAVGGLGPGGELRVPTGATIPQTLVQTAKMAPVNALAGANAQGATEVTGSPLIGAGAGILTPGVLGVGANISRTAAMPFRNPDILAAEKIAGTMGVGRPPIMSPSEVATAQTAGQPTILGDMGTAATQRLARTAANISPEAQAALKTVVNDRFVSQAQRFGDFVKGLYGTDLNSQDVRDALREQATNVNTPAYAAAETAAAAKGGVWNDNLANLMRHPEMASAVKDAQANAAHDAVMAGDPIPASPLSVDDQGNVGLSGAPPTLRYWDSMKKALDSKIGSTPSKDRPTIAKLTTLKSAITNEVDKIVPEYAAARAGASAFFGADNALDAGAKFLDLKKNIALTAAKQAMAKYKPLQKEIFSQGMASDIMQRAINKPERQSIIGQFSAPETRAKMELGLGPDRAKQIEAYLGREELMDRLRTALGNSTTTEQGISTAKEGHGLAGIIGNAIPVPLARGFAAGYGAQELGMSHQHVIMAALGGMASTILGSFAKKISEGTMRRVGEMLASDDPATITRVTKMIGKNPDLLHAMRQAVAPVTGVLAPKLH